MINIRNLTIFLYQDSAFQVNSNPDSVPDPGFDGKKLRKIAAEKNWSFFEKNAIYLSLDHLSGWPSYRRSLQPQKENITALQKMKFINFFLFLCYFWPLWLWSGSRDPIESGSGSTVLMITLKTISNVVVSIMVFLFDDQVDEAKAKVMAMVPLKSEKKTE
jgi:hypothetical protein